VVVGSADDDGGADVADLAAASVTVVRQASAAPHTRAASRTATAMTAIHSSVDRGGSLRARRVTDTDDIRPPHAGPRKGHLAGAGAPNA